MCTNESMCLLSRNVRMCVISVYIIISYIHLGNIYVAALVYVCCHSAVPVSSFIPDPPSSTIHHTILCVRMRETEDEAILVKIPAFE